MQTRARDEPIIVCETTDDNKIVLPYNLGTITKKQMKNLIRKYRTHYQGRVRPIFGENVDIPTWEVQHDPSYNSTDHIVTFWNEEWHCCPPCTGHKMNGICPHIAAVLFYTDDLPTEGWEDAI